MAETYGKAGIKGNVRKMKKSILFIGGSLNQSEMMHEISKHLADCYDCFFTSYYTDDYKALLNRYGCLDFSILGGKFKQDTLNYFKTHDLEVDEGGKGGNYDLVLTGSDLIIQKNIQGSRIILVQEGMTDPENLFYYLVKWFKLPRWFASTSATGLSDAYEKFCVASEGYRDLFIKKGVKAEKIVVTGIPNFDNIKKYLTNSFPYKNYVLAATSDMRETFKYDNRKKFIKKVLDIADGRQVIFKLHPNEKYQRAKREIERYARGALVFFDGNTPEMIANCDVLVTQLSTVIYIGLALGKECYSYFNPEQLKELMPIQNNGTSARNIAAVCESLLVNGARR
jgi:hypothetical protein